MRNVIPEKLGKFSAAAVAALFFTACAGNGTPSTAGSPKIAPEVNAAAQALAAGYSVGPAARSNAAGRLQVYIYIATVSDSALADLGNHGLTDMVPSPGMGVVQGWVLPKDLGALAALPYVNRITLPRYARPY